MRTMDRLKHEARKRAELHGHKLSRFVNSRTHKYAAAHCLHCYHYAIVDADVLPLRVGGAAVERDCCAKRHSFDCQCHPDDMVEEIANVVR